MNAGQSLFVVDLNERRGDRTYLVWSIALKKEAEKIKKEIF